MNTLLRICKQLYTLITYTTYTTLTRTALLPKLPGLSTWFLGYLVVDATLDPLVFPFVFHMVVKGSNAYQIMYHGERLVLPR